MLVFAHGWGFQGSLWHAVGLPGTRVDLGYFGGRRSDLPPRFVGVGHSLGGLWLLSEAAERLDGLVLVGGFARFTEAPGWPGIPARRLDRMRAGFVERPKQTLDAFRGRCGVGDAPEGRDDAALGEGLDFLGGADGREALAALHVPVLCLAARDDPVVPPDLAMATAALAGGAVTWAETGGHLLPLTAPGWCAERIAAWLA